MDNEEKKQSFDRNIVFFFNIYIYFLQGNRYLGVFDCQYFPIENLVKDGKCLAFHLLVVSRVNYKYTKLNDIVIKPNDLSESAMVSFSSKPHRLTNACFDTFFGLITVI